MTQHVSHYHSDQIRELRAEIERLEEQTHLEIERLRRENVELNAELTMLRMENATLRRTLDLKPMRSNLGPGET
jgi:regulator of replication initiation timing